MPKTVDAWRWTLSTFQSEGNSVHGRDSLKNFAGNHERIDTSTLIVNLLSISFMNWVRNVSFYCDWPPPDCQMRLYDNYSSCFLIATCRGFAEEHMVLWEDILPMSVGWNSPTANWYQCTVHHVSGHHRQHHSCTCNPVVSKNMERKRTPLSMLERDEDVLLNSIYVRVAGTPWLMTL